MKYYIDFDNTLFNTEKFYSDLIKLVSYYNITEEKINDCYRRYYLNEFFNPIKIINRLIEKHKFKSEIKKEINDFFNDLSMYLYEDSINFLEYLKKHNYNINVLTYGDFDYQKEKINKTFINDYFDKIIITSKLKSELGLDYENASFIDDNVEQIKGLLKRNAKVIRIRRSGNKHSLCDINGVNEFENFQEYIKFLEKKDI